MPLPRHFSQRPRRGLRPPPHPNQAPDDVEVEAPPVVVSPVVETPPDDDPVAFVNALFGDAPKAESPDEPLAPPPDGKPAWSMLMKKAELLVLAAGFGITVPDEATKAQIIALLDAHAAV